MVGAAVAVARGVLPSWHLDAALQAPFSVPVPLAPPTGLLLVNAGFGSYAKAHVCYNSGPSSSSATTTTTTTTQETGSYGSNTNTSRLKHWHNSEMADERVSPFCLEALRAYGAKVGPTPEEKNEEDEDFSIRSRPQPNHRRGGQHHNQHSSFASRMGPSDRKRVQDDKGGLPVVELMDSAAYAETIKWQVQPHNHTNTCLLVSGFPCAACVIEDLSSPYVIFFSSVWVCSLFCACTYFSISHVPACTCALHA